MCLAVPGKVISLGEEKGAFSQGLVDFQGGSVRVSLALVPEAAPGDWVLVHAGFAISLLDEQAAEETWRYLAEAGMLEGGGEETGA